MRFVLVHGAYHGSWCWDLLIPELERLGHESVAVDLPITDPAAGSMRYSKEIETAADGLDDLVIVGHSMGALSAAVAATRLPVEKLVFLSGLIPRPGYSMNELRSTEHVDGQYVLDNPEFTGLGDDVWEVGPGTASQLFFHDVPAELATWAIANLRPQGYKIMREKTPLDEWPTVETDVIVCGGDRAVDPSWGKWVAETFLHKEAVEIEGGHSPFLSRPGELARLLSELV